MVFFVLPSVARRLWIVLVLYCQLLIFCLYLFNVFFYDFVPAGAEKYFALVGLEVFDRGYTDFWRRLATHSIIFVFTSIQYHLLNMKSFGGVLISSSKF